MAAINANALSTFTGILEVAPIATPTIFSRLASVRGATLNIDNTVNLVEVFADDTQLVYKANIPEARLEGTFLENADRDTMNLLFGGTSANVAGTPVAGATQTLTNGTWNVNITYAITNQMGDGTAPTINSVTGGTDGALTVNDDYDLIQDPISGEWKIVLQDIASATNLTTIAQNIVIDYDYTPNATESNVISMVVTENPRFVARITATEGSTTRRLTISDATFESVYGLEFLDVVQNGDLNGSSFNFRSSRGADLTYENQII